MHETDLNPTHPSSEPAEGLEAAALRAQAWYGEPFLHPGEDPLPRSLPAPRAAARSTMRSPRWRPDAAALRRAGASATASCSGSSACSPSPTPATASGTELRRHQVDALAGMLTELIAANQRDADENGNGNGNGRRPTSPSRRRRARRGGRRLRCRRDRRRRRRRARVHRRGSRAPHGATASATRRRRARRSPPPASSSRPGISAS